VGHECVAVSRTPRGPRLATTSRLATPYKNAPEVVKPHTRVCTHQILAERIPLSRRVHLAAVAEYPPRRRDGRREESPSQWTQRPPPPPAAPTHSDDAKHAHPHPLRHHHPASLAPSLPNSLSPSISPSPTSLLPLSLCAIDPGYLCATDPGAMRRGGDWQTHPHRPRGYLFTLSGPREGRWGIRDVGRRSTPGDPRRTGEQCGRTNAFRTEAHLHRDLCSRNSPHDCIPRTAT